MDSAYVLNEVVQGRLKEGKVTCMVNAFFLCVKKTL